MAAITRAKQLISDAQLLEGIQKYFPNATLTIQAQPETQAEVVAVIQARVDKMRAVILAKAALHSAVIAAEQELASSDAYVRDVRTTVLGMYSTSPQVLGEFGVSPKKAPAPLTTEQKLVALARRSATRAARHTMSAKQKAEIVGTVTGSITVPVDGSQSSLVGGTSSASGSASPTPATPPAAPTTTNGISTP